MPLPGISLGPDVGGGIGAGLENVEPEMLQQELQKQQVQAGKMKLASDQNAMQQQQLQQLDAQAAFIAKIGRNNPGGDTNPQIASQLDSWAQKRGLPSPVVRNDDGSFKINFDAVPGSGGYNDLTDAEKTDFEASPESVRRIKYPGLTEDKYKSQVYISNPAEQDSMRTQWQKLVSGLGKDQTPTTVALWLETTQGATSVISVPEAVSMLQNPDFAKQAIGPAVQAKLDQLRLLGLSDAAKSNWYRVQTQVLPERTAAQITHWQNSDRTAAAGLGIRQQIADADTKKADGYLQSVNNTAGLIAARITDLKARSEQIRTAITNRSTPLAQAGIKALTGQITGLNTLMGNATKQLDALMQIPRPSDDQIAQISTLQDQINGYAIQIQGAQSDLGVYNQAIEQQLSDKTSKGSGKPYTFPQANLPLLAKGMKVPGHPEYTSTGESDGHGGVIVQDANGNKMGYKSQ
jgi:hypothetical protein